MARGTSSRASVNASSTRKSTPTQQGLLSSLRRSRRLTGASAVEITHTVTSSTSFTVDDADSEGEELPSDVEDLRDPTIEASSSVRDELRSAWGVEELVDVDVFPRRLAPSDSDDLIDPSELHGTDTALEDFTLVEDAMDLSEDDGPEEVIPESEFVQCSEDDQSFQHLDHPSHSARIRSLPDNIDLDDSELSFFAMFFSDDIVDNMVNYTNKYIDLHAGSRFIKHVTRADLLRFFAILIYRGLFPCSRLQDYWTKDPAMPHHPDFGMARHRFQTIKRFFKACDPDDEAAAQQAGHRRAYYDKVGPLLDHFVATSQRCYFPSRDLSIDEMIVRFGGRSAFTVKIRGKPVPVGYKILALCDRGYTYAVLPEARGVGNRELNVPHRWADADKLMHDRNVPVPKLTTIGRKVRYLVEQLPQGADKYNLYMDNFFNSVALFEYLRLHGIGACGTVRIHKRGPLALLYPLKTDAKLPRNEFRTFHNGKVGAHFWVDSNAVVVISTIHPTNKKDATIIKTRRRPRDTSSKGGQELLWGNDEHGNRVHVKELEMPLAIHDYNQHMGGVDIADQLRQYYTVQMRSLRNWYPLFCWLLDSSIINAYILRSLHLKSKDKESHRLFRLKLYVQLLAKATRNEQTLLDPGGTMTRGKAQLQAKKPKRATKRQTYITSAKREEPLPEARLVGQHFPSKTPNLQRCYWCMLQSGKRVRTNIQCHKCHIHLCCDPCFREYHTIDVDE